MIYRIIILNSRIAEEVTTLLSPTIGIRNCSAETSSEFIVSRIVDQLQVRISCAKTDTDLACNRAELGCYFARAGRLDEALVIDNEIRANIGIAQRPRVAAWIFLLEGLIRLFGGRSESPQERISRALVLSEAIGDSDMISRASAWKAHLDYLTGDFRSMRLLIDKALLHANNTTLEAVARCWITIGCGYTLVARDDLANKFFGVARDISLSIGDEVSIGAIIFNRAVHRISRERYDSRRNIRRIIENDLIDLEYSSSENFDRFTNNIALSSLSAIWRARLLILQGRASEAQAVLSADLSESAANLREKSSLDIDRAWSHLLLTDVQSAKDVLTSVSRGCLEQMDADDRAIYYSLMIEIDESLGVLREKESSWMGLLQAAEFEHDNIMQRLKEELKGIKLPSA
jgi:hypothetical protein